MPGVFHSTEIIAPEAVGLLNKSTNAECSDSALYSDTEQFDFAWRIIQYLDTDDWTSRRHLYNMTVFRGLCTAESAIPLNISPLTPRRFSKTAENTDTCSDCDESVQYETEGRDWNVVFPDVFRNFANIWLCRMPDSELERPQKLSREAILQNMTMFNGKKLELLSWCHEIYNV